MFRLTLERFASLAVAAGYLLWAYHDEGGRGALEAFPYLLMPIACIWFAHELSYYRGWGNLHIINEASDETAIRIAGWVLLLLPFILSLWSCKQS